MKINSAERRRYLGFTLLEIIIGIAIVALLAKLGYSSYRDFQIRQNREIARHELIIAAAAMEKYYSQNGRYTESSSQWPSGLFESKVSGGTGAVYTISLPVGRQAAQDFSVVATPLQDTIQSNDGNICIDRQGRFTWPANASCGLAVATTSPVNPCPVAAGAEYDAVSSGAQAGSIYRACSGQCSGVLICDGRWAPTGCSGICTNSYVFVKTGTDLGGNSACNGDCSGAVLNVPRDWESRTAVCNIPSGSTESCICNTSTNGSCDNITIVYHD